MGYLESLLAVCRYLFIKSLVAYGVDSFFLSKDVTKSRGISPSDTMCSNRASIIDYTLTNIQAIAYAAIPTTLAENEVSTTHA